jgi:hypothetical protein
VILGIPRSARKQLLGRRDLRPRRRDDHPRERPRLRPLGVSAQGLIEQFANIDLQRVAPVLAVV